ncbi:MAG TPA: CPBP family intramembrane glutamic endopeptidase [Phycisphaerae bacterium]|nr:CPBP family intramembrane glutamic endopeptidase [Phycisphaerae bacterium]
MDQVEFAAVRRAPVETLLLGLVLVAAFHAMPDWLVSFLPAQELYNRLGKNGFYTLYDALSGLMPLLLCLSRPVRAGLGPGHWQGRTWKTLGVCALPIVLTAAIYPLTSRPFMGKHVGIWLVSPAAQDLLFTGYLYPVFGEAFPGRVFSRIDVQRAIPIIAPFFALWHLPNFAGMPIGYVAFQLAYVFIGGAWVLLARQMTGSIWPGVLTHMAVNFIAWRGW